MPDSTIEIRHSVLSTYIPTDTIPIYKIDMEDTKDQSNIFDANDPSPTTFLAKNACTRTIPISSLREECIDNCNICGQLDAAAHITCSNTIHLFHNYKPYTETFRSPLQLTVAIKKSNSDINSSIIPEGEGYFLIPASNIVGCVPVKAYYSPYLQFTLIGENYLLGSTKRQHKQFSSQTIYKYFTQSTFSIKCTHKMRSK